MNLNEIITYAPNVTVCVTANDVVGTIKIMDVDASGTETGLVLSVLPEGAVSQTPVTLQSGSIKAVAESGATVGSIQVLRPVAPFKAAPALASAGGGIESLDFIPSDGNRYALTRNEKGELSKAFILPDVPFLELDYTPVYVGVSTNDWVYGMIPPGNYIMEINGVFYNNNGHIASIPSSYFNANMTSFDAAKEVVKSVISEWLTLGVDGNLKMTPKWNGPPPSTGPVGDNFQLKRSFVMIELKETSYGMFSNQLGSNQGNFLSRLFGGLYSSPSKYLYAQKINFYKQ